MIASPQPLYLTEQEYLQMEEHSSIKHEYIDGQILAMAGASDAHVTIAGNLFALLGFDRGDKFADYETLESLQEYVLLNSKRQRVECFRRNEKGLWELQSYTPMHQTFQLPSIEFEGAIATLYEDVAFPEPPEASLAS